MAKPLRRSVLLVAMLLFCLQPAIAGAAAPYESYNYNFYEEAVHSPAAYLPQAVITGSQLGIGDFSDPQDVHVAANGLIYVLDSGNNRIVELNKKLELQRVIKDLRYEGRSLELRNPSGLASDDEGKLYIADTGNKRIVIIDTNSTSDVIGIIEQPVSDLLSDGFQFTPLKLSVDRASRVYVVAQGVFEGIMQFDADGRFLGYVGTNKVRPAYGDIIWRYLSTKEQRARMVLFIPTEFSNVDMDEKGFVYSTNIDPGTKEPIKRLNPSGEDVLKRYGYHDVVGDIRYRTRTGPSRLIDVKVHGHGMYSVLDASQGKVFTYNEEGDLLYIYGSRANQNGTFRTPAAMESFDDKHLVLDRGKRQLVLFEPTAFGSHVNAAVRLHASGEEQQAVKHWEEVLKLNMNYDIAYIGIGKSLLMQRENKQAMHYFKLGMDRKNYSVAYKRYRREVLKEHLGTAMTVVVVGSALLILGRQLQKRRRPGGSDQQPPIPGDGLTMKGGGVG